MLTMIIRLEVISFLVVSEAVYASLAHACDYYPDVYGAVHTTQRTWMNCPYGCCGDLYDRHCCKPVSGIIAGAIVGGLIPTGIIVCVIYYCIKDLHVRRSTVQPLIITQTGRESSMEDGTTARENNSYKDSVQNEQPIFKGLYSVHFNNNHSTGMPSVSEC